jgi:hypothetical protein
VGGIIVDDEMQVEIGRRPFVDGLEEAEELAMPVARHACADDGAVEHVESREQGRGAVALVVMRHRPAAALLHRQPRLGAVKGLDLALFIDRQHQGLVGRIEVEADNLLDLGDEARIARELEGFRQMWLEPVRSPDLVHRRRRDASPRRHRAFAPVGGSPACYPGATRKPSRDDGKAAHEASSRRTCSARHGLRRVVREAARLRLPRAHDGAQILHRDVSRRWSQRDAAQGYHRRIRQAHGGAGA